jgi:hypothetical protein
MSLTMERERGDIEPVVREDAVEPVVAYSAENTRRLFADAFVGTGHTRVFLFPRSTLRLLEGACKAWDEVRVDYDDVAAGGATDRLMVLEPFKGLLEALATVRAVESREPLRF